jgi:iron complex transport system permease protein
MSRRLIGFGGAGLALLLLTLLLCLGIGSAKLPVSQIAGILVNHLPWLGETVTPDWNPSTEQIILKVRLPRVLLGMLVGAALALAGAGFQGVLRNPLADPYTLGVSSGASVGAAVLIYWGLDVVDGADAGEGRRQNSDSKSHFIGRGDAILSGSRRFLSDSHVEGDGQ